MIPLKIVFPIPAMYLVYSSRILLFGRYFGLLSLFAASVNAAGLDVQKQQNAFFILVMSAIFIALNIPIDNFAWDSTFVHLSAYDPIFDMVEAVILAVTILTFFISAYTRGSKTYIFIGLGTLLLYAGREILLNSDTWITLLPGLLILSIGTWFVCTMLHREYLWY